MPIEPRCQEYLRATMISRTKTIKPMIPPPLPYFQAFSWMVISPVGAPRARAKKENWRRKLTMLDNMLTDLSRRLQMVFGDGLIEVAYMIEYQKWAVRLYLKMGKGPRDKGVSKVTQRDCLWIGWICWSPRFMHNRCQLCGVNSPVVATRGQDKVTLREQREYERGQINMNRSIQ